MRLRNDHNKNDPVIIPVPQKKNSKSKLWCIFRYSSIIMVIMVVAFFYYYNNYIKISGIVIISTNKVTVSSPGEAIVESMPIFGEFESVEDGQQIAQLGIYHTDILGLKKEIYLQQEKILSIDQEIQALNSKKSQEKLLFQRKVRDFDFQSIHSKEELKSLALQVESQKSLLALLLQEQLNANELYKLEVVDKGVLKKLQTEIITAQKDYSLMALKVMEVNALLKDKLGQAKNLKSDLSTYVEEIDKTIKGLTNLRTHMRQQLSDLEQVQSGKNINVTLYSPVNGRVLENHISTGDSLSLGDPIVTLYRPDSMELQAYVEERFMDQVSVGDAAMVKIYKYEFESKVLRINKLIINSPKELKGRNLNVDDKYFFTLLLDTQQMPKELFPGKTGTVIFKQ